MLEKGHFRNRRVVFGVIGVIGVGALLAAFAIKILPGMLMPKVVSTKRSEAELALPAKIPARETLVMPKVVDSTEAVRTIAPDNSVLGEAVDGGDYITELGRVAGLTEHEQTQMRPFLELIARSQELVARTSDPERRADMTRRLQYQAVYGMKLRVAPEKRDKVVEALQKGVPRLLFPNAKKPNVITQKLPVSSG